MVDGRGKIVSTIIIDYKFEIEHELDGFNQGRLNLNGWTNIEKTSEVGCLRLHQVY